MLYWKQTKSNKISKINYLALDLQFFAKKKGGGAASTNCNHDSNSKSRGVKKFGGERITSAGSIIVRQLGSKFRAGNNVHSGKDFTLHASCEGIVKYYQKKIRGKNKSFVEVIKKE